MKKVGLLLLFIVLSLSCVYAQTTFSQGDIFAIGWNADADDDILFLSFVDIESGTKIYFRDDEYNNGWVDNNEGCFSWTCPVDGISAGDVVEIFDCSLNPPTASVGSCIFEDGSFNISGTENAVYVYTSSSGWNSGTFTFITAFCNQSTLDGLLNGTSLTEGTDAWAWGNVDNWKYNGSRSGASIAAVKALVQNSDNWESNDSTPYTFSTDPFTLPVTLSAFTAQYLNSKPTLYWQTQSEVDNMGWFIYRNTIEDFTSAEKITGMIEGHGTTTQPQSYIYEDAEELQIEQTYYYWLESVDYSGTIHHYDRVVHITIPHPNDPGQNVTPPIAYDISADPNPFSYTTNISFVMDQPSLVDVAIYNVKGQLVKSFSTVMTTSENEFVNFHWNGKDNTGRALSNGVYLYSVKVNGKDYATKQLILMK